MNQATNYFRVVTCVPKVYPGQPKKNAEIIIKSIKKILKENNFIDLIVFPELSITGYTCGDLFLTEDLWINTQKAISKIHSYIKKDIDIILTVILGAPIKSRNGSLYNCGLIFSSRKDTRVPIYVYPKKNLPEYSEFYEKRWFKEGPKDINEFTLTDECEFDFSVLTSGIVNIGSVLVGLEICEDLWVPNPPSCELVIKRGAEVVVNISASPDLIGKTEYLKDLLRSTSGRFMCGYVYVSSGPWESSTDLVFSGNQYVYENGKYINGSSGIDTLNPEELPYTVTDIDLDEIRGYRRRSKLELHMDNRINIPELDFYREDYDWEPPIGRTINPHPFLDSSNYDDVLRIQSLGLQRRLLSCGGENCKSIIGISGGTDSTWALIVTCDAYEKLGYDRKNIIGVTMPCFGTSERTKSNSWKLINLFGITGKEINIKESVTAHLKEMGHALDVYDIAYENAQARIRTVTLFDISNMEGGIVIGTGDLSELALGWCTYGADHLSSYNVNVSVPKTLIKKLINNFAWQIVDLSEDLHDCLLDILGTPVSPELLPLDENGKIAQVSEDKVGPYELHDFFLYHFLRTGMKAAKLAHTCFWAFKGKYDLKTIIYWERKFFERFSSQQFKRSCLPDGPKVGSVSLSPRGDWRMPSDISLKEYLSELSKYEQ